MKFFLATTAAVIGVAALLWFGWSTAEAGGAQNDSPDQAESPPSHARVSLAEARRQAELLHEAMHATLQIVHHRYYVEDEGLPLPAFALREVFAEVEKEKQVTLRWLAVEGAAMNTDHKAATPFEVAAVQALGKGEKSHEAVSDGLYRRAGAITLGSHCLKCHVPDRTSTESRTAGLIIAIPIQQP